MISTLNYLRKNMIDKYSELRDIPDELLKTVLNTHTNDSQRLEFLGDAVLEILIREFLFNKSISGEGKMSFDQGIIVSNVSLACLAEVRGLCNLGNKKCADIFESLLGTLYYYLRKKNNPNVIDILKNWLIAEYDIEYIIDQVIMERPKNICDINRGVYNKEDISLFSVKTEADWEEYKKFMTDQQRKKYKEFLENELQPLEEEWQEYLNKKIEIQSIEKTLYKN